MQSTNFEDSPQKQSERAATAGAWIRWTILGFLTALLGISAFGPLWRVWTTDPALSHGPIVPIIAIALIWSRRANFSKGAHADKLGLACMVLCALLFTVAVWADIVFLRPLAFIGIAGGAIWFLAGRTALMSSLVGLGFLVFMIPWPTTLVDRVSFPLQLTSSAYATLFGGALGLPLERDGVEINVVPDVSQKPVYSVVIARECSGLTSLMVLLAIGYLAALFTRVSIGWRAAMLASVIPLALFANAVRITLILLAGARSGEALAQWIHDNEAPFLMTVCSLGLIAFRQALLANQSSKAVVVEVARG